MNIENGRLETSFSQLHTSAVLIREQGKFTKHPCIYGCLTYGGEFTEVRGNTRLFESGCTEVHTKSIKPLKLYISSVI